jgi:hypothetical protein
VAGKEGATIRSKKDRDTRIHPPICTNAASTACAQMNFAYQFNAPSLAIILIASSAYFMPARSAFDY